MDATVSGCKANVACLIDAATAKFYEPVTMGHVIAKQLYDYAIRDGYNQLGTDDGCMVSCSPYSDVTGYAPPADSSTCEIERWLPLVEDNGHGFFYRQEHVTPHSNSSVSTI